jgi:hypothetical protein
MMFPPLPTLICWAVIVGIVLFVLADFVHW